MAETQTLAVVIAIYNEQENLPELFQRLRTTFARMPGITPTVIYVNDGSTDDSLPIMLRQHAEDPRFTIVDLSRNFGHQSAIMAKPLRDSQPISRKIPAPKPQLTSGL